MSAQPDPAVLEWGAQPRRLVRWRRVDPRLTRLIAGLGVLALFGSFLGEWQLTDVTELLGITEPIEARLGAAGAWGLSWVVGALLLLSCTGLALLGQFEVRAVARGVGLAVAGGLTLMIMAASVDLAQQSLAEPRLFGFGGLQDATYQVTLGRGLFAAYAALALLAVALWLATTTPAAAPLPAPGLPTEPAEPAAVPPGYAGPGDLEVGPAEPFPVSVEAEPDQWR